MRSMVCALAGAAALATCCGGERAAANPKRNVLYIVFDDLRPDLEPYGQSFMSTPNIQRLADTGLVFDRAFVQIAVCSPSRMSFTTGRRPNGTQTWNFINHFREARCTQFNNLRVSEGVAMEGGFNSQPHGWGYTRTGGFAQCCTSCTALKPHGCTGWSYTNGICTLYSTVTARAPCEGQRPPSIESFDTCISGDVGAYPKWTPLPANFRENGYLVLGSGKYYHDGCASLGGAKDDKDHPQGQGHPPLADRELSWTPAGPNGTIQFPDQRIYTEKWGHVKYAYGNFQYMVPDDEPCGGEGGPSSDYCTPSHFPLDGSPGTPPKKGTQPLADFVTYNDAITKMRFAKRNLESTGQPFFMVTGIKRPHLNWRSPPGYVDLYPLQNVSLPKQRTLDRSIDPVAWAAFPMNAPLNGTETGLAAHWPRDSSLEDLDPESCGSYHSNTGGGKDQTRVATYPDGLAVRNMSECCTICRAGNSINCTAWIYHLQSHSQGINCWPMAVVHGTRSVKGNVIGGHILPGPPAPAPSPKRSPNFVTSPYVDGTDHQLRLLRQHYYATVSWADYVAGRVLSELDALGLSASTMVVLHSDHGWHLGEYAEWEKRTNWELGTRIPLIMRVPWMPSAASGKHARGLVEAVDIYQTVCDIMGVPLPADTVPFEGTSLRPILEAPETATVKDVALSTFPRCTHVGMPVYGNRGSPGGLDNTCLDVERTDFTWMGYTMRTDRYRYTEYVVWNGTSLSPIWPIELKATELYDHDGDDGAWTDPDKYENINEAKTAEPSLVARLSKQLHAAFGFP